jgi:hypothetical protein
MNWLLDADVIGLPALAHEVWLNPLVVIAAAAVLVVALNVPACTWINREYSNGSGSTPVPRGGGCHTAADAAERAREIYRRSGDQAHEAR